MSTLQENCEKFKLAVNGGDISAAKMLLKTLKLQLMELDSLPPVVMESPNAEAERILARQVYEHAVILAVKDGNKEEFQRFLSTLRPYYNGFSDAVSQSELKPSIVGLHLLFLLVENQLADFHSELELLTEDQKKHSAISFCTQLDRHLMIGSYDQVLQEAASPPVEFYSFFLTSLLETVRVNICECVLAAYRNLTLQAATKVLMFNSVDETVCFFNAHYPELDVSSSTTNIDLGSEDDRMLHRSEDIPSLRLINQTLSYATELERIV